MKRLFLIFCCCLIAACAGPDVRQYQKNLPQLNLLQFFEGKTQAWGIFQKFDGSVAKRFQVELTGTRTEHGLTLDERFKYDDGTTQTRIWHLTLQADGSWTGTADDVKGQARGVISGNALHWEYTMLLPVDGSIYEMQFDDWMFLMDDKSMMNRASMRKFGIELGQVSLFFQKREP